jgi:hypothetical protein
MLVFHRFNSSPNSKSRNKKILFRRRSFAARLLLSVLSTLVVVEPMPAFATTSQTAQPQEPWPQEVQQVQNELPYNGMLDLYHDVKKVGEVEAAMYALRNSVFMDNLVTRAMVKRMLGGSARAKQRAQELGRTYYADPFAVPNEAKRLFINTIKLPNGQEKRTIYPEFASYIDLLDDESDTQAVSAQDRETVLIQLLHGAINTASLDQELKFYSNDFWAYPAIRDEFDRTYMGVCSWDARIHFDGDTQLGMLQTCAAEYQNQQDRWLKSHGMENTLAAIAVERDEMSQLPLLSQTVALKKRGFAEAPLYQNLYQLLKQFQFRDSSGKPVSAQFPSQDYTQTPVAANLPRGPIPYPAEFEGRIRAALTTAGGFGMPVIVHDAWARQRLDDLVDLALLNTLADTTRAMQDWLANIDYYVEGSSKWAQQVLSDYSWNRAMQRYQYLARYNDVRDGKAHGYVDFDQARKILVARAENYNRISDHVKTGTRWVGYAGSAIFIGASFFVGPEGPAATFLFLTRAGWLTAAGIAGGLSAAGFWYKWRRSAQAEQMYREGIMIRNDVDPREIRAMRESKDERHVAKLEFFGALTELVLMGLPTKAFRALRLSRFMDGPGVIIRKSDAPAIQLVLKEAGEASKFSIRAKNALAWIHGVFENPRFVRLVDMAAEKAAQFKKLPLVRNVVSLCSKAALADRRFCEEMTVFAITDYGSEIYQRWDSIQDGTVNVGDAIVSATGSTLMTTFLVWTTSATISEEMKTAEARLRLQAKVADAKELAANLRAAPWETVKSLDYLAAMRAGKNTAWEFSRLGMKSCVVSLSMYGILGGLGYRSAALAMTGASDPEQWGDEAGKALAMGAAACGYSGVYSTFRYRFLKEPIANFLAPLAADSLAIRYVVRLVPRTINNFEGGYRFIPYSQGAYTGVPVAEVRAKEKPVAGLPHQTELDPGGIYIKNSLGIRPEVWAFPFLDDRPAQVVIQEDHEADSRGLSPLVSASDISR